MSRKSSLTCKFSALAEARDRNCLPHNAFHTKLRFLPPKGRGIKLPSMHQVLGSTPATKGEIQNSQAWNHSYVSEPGIQDGQRTSAEWDSQKTPRVKREAGGWGLQTLAYLTFWTF